MSENNRLEGDGEGGRERKEEREEEEEEEEEEIDTAIVINSTLTFVVQYTVSLVTHSSESLNV